MYCRTTSMLIGALSIAAPATFTGGESVNVWTMPPGSAAIRASNPVHAPGAVAAPRHPGQTAEPSYTVVLPGSDALDASRIRPHAVRYEKPDAFMRYEMEEVEHQGRRVLRLSVFYNTEAGPPDDMYFDAETLAYVRRRHETDDYIVDVAVRDNHLSGDLIAKPGSDFRPRTYDMIYPHGGFEPAIMNYWIAALPLADGYRASIPIIDLSNRLEMTWADIEVVGRETLEFAGQSYETWKVTSRNGERLKTIWVSADVPYALRMELRGSPGAWIAKQTS